MQLTADKILAMTSRDASSLFSGGAQDVRRGFAKLAAKWHPDVCSDPRAEDVFTHILSLRGRVSGNSQNKKVKRIFKTKEGRSFATSPLAQRMVDLGEIVLGERTVSTLFPEALSDLGAKESQATSLFRFEDEKMKEQMRPFLPNLLRSVEIQGGGCLVIVEKTRDEILLADLLDKEGSMPDVHAAWLCSGLLNICAWM